MESDNLKSISIRYYLYLCQDDEEEDGMVALWYGNVIPLGLPHLRSHYIIPITPSPPPPAWMQILNTNKTKNMKTSQKDLHQPGFKYK